MLPGSRGSPSPSIENRAWKAGHLKPGGPLEVGKEKKRDSTGAVTQVAVTACKPTSVTLARTALCKQANAGMRNPEFSVKQLSLGPS